MFTAVVRLDSTKQTQRETEYLSDWVVPLLEHPLVRDIHFCGATEGLTNLPMSGKLHLHGPELDEWSLVMDVGARSGVAGVLRLYHQASLRFPITAGLLDAVLDRFGEVGGSGYFQMDLSDLPYPYLNPEVLGRNAIREMLGRPDFTLDWNAASIRFGSHLIMQRSNLPLAVRQEYLDNPAVEYFSFPKFIALESTRLCNLRCTMCVTHSDLIDHSHLEKYPKHFDLGKYRWILDQLEPYREHLSIAPQFQGEPFMAPDIKDMIRYATAKGFWIGFTTNATLWDDETIEFLIDQEVKSLCVSLDGATKETYEQIRVGADFDKVLANIRKLIRRKDARGSWAPSLIINMTLLPENRHQQELLLSEWLGKAQMVSINNACVNHVVPEKFYQPERYPCPFLWEGMHILTNGDVIACCRDSDYEEVMGNAYREPILEIWNNAKYRAFRGLHSQGQWDAIPMCSRCDTWMCKSKQTLGDAGRMLFQHPFHRQYLPFHAAQTGPRPSGAMHDLWGAMKSASQKAAGGLIRLGVRAS